MPVSAEPYAIDDREHRQTPTTNAQDRRLHEKSLDHTTHQQMLKASRVCGRAATTAWNGWIQVTCQAVSCVVAVRTWAQPQLLV